MNTKRCTKCGNEYPATVEFFYRAGNSLRPDCKECCNLRNHQSYVANLDKNRERIKVYREKNHDEILASKALYREKHREELALKQRQYRLKNLSKVREQEKRAYETKKTKRYKWDQKWRKANRHQIRHFREVRRTRKQGLPATFTDGDWKNALEYFSNRCAVCGQMARDGVVLAQDHWLPISLGGGYTKENIVPLCHGKNGCNNSKGGRSPHEWLVKKYGEKLTGCIEAKIAAYFAWVKAREAE